MKLHDDYDEHSGMTPTVVMTIVAVTVFVAAILVVVLLLNNGKKNSGNGVRNDVEQEESTSPIILSSEADEWKGSNLHPDDLDFWDKYPPEETETPVPEESLPREQVENDPSTDGKHTLVQYADGSEEWVLISPYLPKHEYDFTRLVCQSGLMKYYENGKQVSYVGVDVSKLQDYIDFVKVKKAGIDFVMIRAGARGYGTGQLPDKEGQMYHCEVDDLYLIPTAEVPVTNIYRDVILDEKDLPIKNCAYTQCFRREAGSYGKDVRGLNRLHEFSKIEIVRIDKPEHSKESHKEMLEHVEGLLKKLELPYRILLLCGGDQSFTSAICYDFEVYSEAQGRWLEVSSVSNFDTYQANRLKCRYRHAEDKKIELCHTLNGSALALPRIVAAIIEDNQTPEGIRVPRALVPYMGCEIIN